LLHPPERVAAHQSPGNAPIGHPEASSACVDPLRCPVHIPSPFGEHAVDGDLPVWKRNLEAVEFDHTVGAMADKARTAACVKSVQAQALPRRPARTRASMKPGAT
jgi:hypothetical protein